MDASLVGHEIGVCEPIVFFSENWSDDGRVKGHSGLVSHNLRVSKESCLLRKIKAPKVAKDPGEIEPNLVMRSGNYQLKLRIIREGAPLDYILELSIPKFGICNVCSECEAFFEYGDFAGRHFVRTHATIWRQLKYPTG